MVRIFSEIEKKLQVPSDYWNEKVVQSEDLLDACGVACVVV